MNTNCTRRKQFVATAISRLRTAPVAPPLCILTVAILVGCGDANPPPVQSVASEQSASLADSGDSDKGAGGERPASTSAQDGTPSDENPGTSSLGGAFSARQPVTHSTHPIDQIEEGRRYRFASRRLDAGDDDPAKKLISDLSSAKSDYAPLAAALTAQMLIRDGEFEKALGLASEISQIPIMQVEAYTLAGEVFYRSGQFAKAIANFRNAVVQNPQHKRAHLWLGACYYDTGAMRLATEHLRKAAELDPDEVNAAMLSGRIHREYEQYADAIADFKVVLERQPAAVLADQARVECAECYLAVRELELASALLSGMTPSADVLGLSASIAEAEGDSPRAESAARSALELNPTEKRAALVLGRLLLGDQQWDDVVDLLEPVLEAHSFDHELRFLLARALLGSGNRDQGRQQLERATELKEKFLRFAELHQDAIKRPRDVPVRNELAELALALGKPELAASWYRAALGLEPENKVAKEGMSKLGKTVGSPP